MLMPSDAKEDWASLVSSVLDSNINVGYLNEVTEDGNAYDDLLYWLSWLDIACAETEDQVYVFVSEETKDQLRWNSLEFVKIYIHITQTQILDEVADTNLEYYGREVVIRRDGRPILVLSFRDDPGSGFSSFFTTSNLRVWG